MIGAPVHPESMDCYRLSPFFVNLMIVQVPCVSTYRSILYIYFWSPNLQSAFCHLIRINFIYGYIPSISVLHSWFHFLKPIMMISLNNSHHVFSRIYLMISPQQIPNEWLVPNQTPDRLRQPVRARSVLTWPVLGHKFTTQDWERFIHTMVYTRFIPWFIILGIHTIPYNKPLMTREWELYIHTSYKNNNHVGKTVINHSFRELYIHTTYKFMVMAGGWCRCHWELPTRFDFGVAFFWWVWKPNTNGQCGFVWK